MSDTVLITIAIISITTAIIIALAESQRQWRKENFIRGRHHSTYDMSYMVEMTGIPADVLKESLESAGIYPRKTYGGGEVYEEDAIIYIQRVFRKTESESHE